MTETIPSDEVLREAARRMGWPNASLWSNDALRHQYLCGGVYREMCDALTQPAWEPPVSPEKRAAREAMARLYDEKMPQVAQEYRNGERDHAPVIREYLDVIELCDQYRKEV